MRSLARRHVSIGRYEVPLTIVAYGAIAALWQAWVILPGGPSPAEDGAATFWLVVTALLVLGLARGSAAAWTISFALDGLVLFAVVWVTALDDAVVVAAAVAAALEVALLLAPATRAHVGIGGRRVRSASL